METYTKDEFIKTAMKRGYAYEHHAQMYVGQNPKTLYTEEDLMDLYRFENREPTWDTPMYGKTAEERTQEKRDSWL